MRLCSTLKMTCKLFLGSKLTCLGLERSIMQLLSRNRLFKCISLINPLHTFYNFFTVTNNQTKCNLGVHQELNLFLIVLQLFLTLTLVAHTHQVKSVISRTTFHNLLNILNATLSPPNLFYTIMKPLLLLMALPFTEPNCFCVANETELLLLLLLLLLLCSSSLLLLLLLLLLTLLKTLLTPKLM